MNQCCGDTIGVSHRSGDSESCEIRCIDFSITESSFSISSGGSVYSKNVGSDSYSEAGWSFELGCESEYQEWDSSLDNIPSLVEELLNLGAVISVGDESEIEFEDDEGHP